MAGILVAFQFDKFVLVIARFVLKDVTGFYASFQHLLIVVLSV
jgi:hypothetical protein